MRKALAVIAWVLAAAGLTSVGTAAVGLVTSQVNEPPPTLLSVEALEALPSVATVPSTAPSITTPPPPISAVDPPTTTATAPPTTTNTVSPATTTTLRATTTTTSLPSATTTTSPPSSTTTTSPTSSTTTTIPALELRTFHLIGGSVVVEILTDGIAWRSSTPKAGFAVAVDETGPEKVVVEFESTDPNSDRSSHLEVLWVDGNLEWKIDEDD